MAIRQAKSTDRAGRLARLKAKNARLRKRAADLAAEAADSQTARGARRRDGAVDPAHRLLAAVPRQQ
jgi:hypothetical protein